MSELPRKRVPTRRVVDSDEDEYEYEAPPPQRRGAPTRPVNGSQARGNGGRPYPNANPRSAQYSRRPVYVDAAPRRDIFPFVMGGIIGALVVGLMVVIFILSSNNNNNGAANTAASTGNQNNPNVIPQPNGTEVVQPQATSVYEPVRMELAAFKALYDNPAKRPIIIDVRNSDIYDQGHITGAINIPQDQVDAKLNEIPKDKLVILYCQ